MLAGQPLQTQVRQSHAFKNTALSFTTCSIDHHVFSKATVSQPMEKSYNFTHETAGTSVPSL